jgi:hypothetical protein
MAQTSVAFSPELIDATVRFGNGLHENSPWFNEAECRRTCTTAYMSVLAMPMRMTEVNRVLELFRKTTAFDIGNSYEIEQNSDASDRELEKLNTYLTRWLFLMNGHKNNICFALPRRVTEEMEDLGVSFPHLLRNAKTDLEAAIQALLTHMESEWILNWPSRVLSVIQELNKEFGEMLESLYAFYLTAARLCPTRTRKETDRHSPKTLEAAEALVELSNPESRSQPEPKDPPQYGGVSLCIPRVFSNISEARIKNVFHNLGFPQIFRVDMVKQETTKMTPEGERTQTYNRVFIHLCYYDQHKISPQVNDLLKRMMRNGEVKIMYDTPWYWIVRRSTSQMPAEAPQTA